MTDAAFLAAFEAGTLPRAEWTHAAHVRLAWLYLGRLPPADALERMRAGIRRYNAAVGTPPDAYHDTVTVAFARLIHAAGPDPAEGFAAFARRNPGLFDRADPVLLRYYSPDRLSSPAARAGFVEPDRRPLPGGTTVDDDLATLIGRELADELGQAFGRVEHCLAQLTDTQAWWRPRADLNSVGNLVLHLAGNVRQWIGSGLGGAPDARDRQAEFDERREAPRAELSAVLRSAVEEARAVLTGQSAAGWSRERPVRGRPATGLGAAVHSVAHFRGHAQEVVHLTRTILGDRYRFAGPPPGARAAAPPRPPLTRADALAFARDWADAWNSRDLDRVLAHYADDFTMSSPFVRTVTGEPSGTLFGKAAVGAYWRAALDRFPELYFEVLDAYAGADSVVVRYRSVAGLTACEVLAFGPDGRVGRAAAHYDGADRAANPDEPPAGPS